MKQLTELKPTERTQTRAKSVLEFTPFELAEIDAYQNRNRGWEEDDHREIDSFGLEYEDENRPLMRWDIESDIL